MEYIVRSEERISVLPCECGAYPIFEHPNNGWTDTWLKNTIDNGGLSDHECA